MVVKIIGIQPYGAFCRLDEEWTGLMHISEISDRFVRRVADYFTIGDTIKATIIEVDTAKKRAKLSLRRNGKNRHRYAREQLRKKKEYRDKCRADFPVLQAKIAERVREIWLQEGEEMVKTDLTRLIDAIPFDKYAEKVREIERKMQDKTAAGSDYLGWREYPNEYNEKEIAYLIDLAAEYKSKYDVLVVVGIGGSYLGAKAAIEALNGLYPKKGMEIVYLGETFSPTYTKQVLDYLRGKNFAVNVISKSGTTLETSLAFRFLRSMLEKKYGQEEAKERVVATTDKENGSLIALARLKGYRTLYIPGDIGGRYSVITPVGLFPIACADIDVYEILSGAKRAYLDLRDSSLESNAAYRYAVARRYLYENGYKAEMMINYEPQMSAFNEWWKQLFGESEGKEKKGLLPVSAIFSTDLHSLGQFIQDGSPILFETTLRAKNFQDDLTIEKYNVNLDELNYLANKTLNYTQNVATLATLKAHFSTGKVPNIVLEYERMDAKTFGYLVYFFMRACAVSAYLNDVNPFNQPGVEVYKKNMREIMKGK